MANKISVAIQGERGSYSDEATVQLLRDAAQVHYCEHFEDVFRLTAERKVQYCLIPIENSLTGSIHKNYDLLLRHRLNIFRETNHHIEHHLIVLPGTPLEKVDTVISHPVALDQCESFFERFTHLRKQSAYDTSGSVKRIVEQKLENCAAIASKRAAEYYGGQIIMSGIEDNKENFTRFFLLSQERKVEENADKTSVVFSFRNAPGALFKCLSVFALQGIDLTKIESRPIRGRPWEYLFYLDFLGNIEEEKTRNALNHLREITEFLEVLGCYLRDATHGKRM